MKIPEEEKSNSIFKELGIALFELFAGSIKSKAGLILLLSVLGFIFLGLQIVGENEKPLAFYIIGAILMIGAAYLLILRVIEIKKNKQRKKN
jgi:hypothetical protein